MANDKQRFCAAVSKAGAQKRQNSAFCRREKSFCPLNKIYIVKIMRAQV